jgi:pyrophosphatase PpaX
VTTAADSRGAVLFDWDGTLVDSAGALVATWHDVTTEVLGRRWPVEPDDVRLALSRRGAETFPLLTDDPDVVGRMAEAFTPAYEAHAAEGVCPFPGVPELLEGLAARGVALGVVTSKARVRYRADAERGLLAHLFGGVACAEDVIRGKPDPQAVHHVLALLGVPPERAVLVGDTDADVASGRAAGVRTIGVTWGSSDAEHLRVAGAEAVVDSVAELDERLRVGPCAVPA